MQIPTMSIESQCTVLHLENDLIFYTTSKRQCEMIDANNQRKSFDFFSHFSQFAKLFFVLQIENDSPTTISVHFVEGHITRQKILVVIEKISNKRRKIAQTLKALES